MSKKKKLQAEEAVVALPKSFVGTEGHLCGSDTQEVSRINGIDHRKMVVLVSRDEKISLEQANNLVQAYF